MSDTFDFDCPHCQQRLRVAADAAGKQIRCPDCSNLVTVPGPTGITEEAPRTYNPPPLFESEPSESRDRDRRRDYDDDDRDALPPVRRRGSGGGGLTAAAICILVVSGLALLLDLFAVVSAVAADPPRIDPNLPPIMQEIVKNSHGTTPAISNGVLALIAGFTIIGAIQMLRRKTWGLCLAASILSMIHIGSCCCVLGAPFGIWALVMLMNTDVKDSFS